MQSIYPSATRGPISAHSVHPSLTREFTAQNAHIRERPCLSLVSIGVRWMFATIGLTVVLLTGGALWLPAVGAGALLHPARRHVSVQTPPSCRDVEFSSGDVVLAGWHCPAKRLRRGVVVYLHGIADNRASGVGIIDRFVTRGFDVVTYDSRAHGESTGTACTYGIQEKHDLRRVLDTLEPGPVVVLGTSLGAAVALQAAAEDSRISSVVAAEIFSDLRTVATERAPFPLKGWALDRVFDRARRDGGLDVNSASPVAAATRVTVPVLLVHGADDVDTHPAHSRRVFAALKGQKRLLIVPGRAHNRSLHGDVWQEIDTWVDQAGL